MLACNMGRTHNIFGGRDRFHDRFLSHSEYKINVKFILSRVVLIFGCAFPIFSYHEYRLGGFLTCSTMNFTGSNISVDMLVCKCIFPTKTKEVHFYVYLY